MSEPSQPVTPLIPERDSLPMDLLFYGLAVYEGYRFARVPDAPPPVALA